MNIGVGFFLFVVALRGLIHYDTDNWDRFMADTNTLNPLLSLLSPVWLLVAVSLVVRGVSQVIIDPAARTLTRKFLFGLVRRIHSIHRHTETGVHIRVGEGSKRIVLRHFAKTATVDTFVADTQTILGETI